MLKYLVRRLLSIVPVMAIVAVIVFLLAHMGAGDPAAVIAGDSATAEDIASIHQQLGLDAPLPQQFLVWVWQILHGDLGNSYFSSQPVMLLISQRIWPTLWLALTTIVISVLIGVSLGVVAAANAGKFLDRTLMVLTTIGFSAPAFVIGYILVFVFAVKLAWLPVQGYVPPGQNPYGFVRAIILPSLTLSFSYIALISRISRASVLEALAQEYVLTASAKGLSDGQVLRAHVMRNAAVPITTVVGIGIALLIGGVVITESVFNIPGIGRLVVDSVTRKDYPVIQGVTLIFAGVYVLINLLVDLLAALFDPRIRL